MDYNAEFDRWWNTFKSQATRQYPVKAAREAWAACATLMANRVKELEAEIKELKFAYDTSHNADQFLIKTARTKLIKELRRWIFMEYVPVFDKLVVDKDKLLAKLDLLEGEK